MKEIYHFVQYTESLRIIVVLSVGQVHVSEEGGLCH